jgi:hypothetical protein
MKLLVTGLAALVLAFGTVALSEPKAEAAPREGALTLPVVNAPITDSVLGQFVGGTYTGDVTLTRFFSQGGQIWVEGVANGTATDTLGNTVPVNSGFMAPVTSITQQEVCQILDLTLGPLHLDLLGLVVDLSQVDLDITAVPGEGNLLGNLLCSIAGLLDQGGSLDRIVRELNRVLVILA